MACAIVNLPHIFTIDLETTPYFALSFVTKEQLIYECGGMNSPISNSFHAFSRRYPLSIVYGATVSGNSSSE